MTLGFILTIIVIILIFIILFKILSSILKATIVIFTILLVFSLIFGVIFFVDANSFKKDIQNKDSIFLFMKNDSILSSFKVENFNFSNIESTDVNEPTQVDEETEQVFVVTEDAISQDEEILNELEQTESEEEKQIIFSEYISKNVNESGLSYLYTQLKEGGIYVWEKTPFVKILKYTPQKLLNLIDGEDNK